MDDNYKQEFLDMLDVEINEGFNLEDKGACYSEFNPYHFDENLSIIDKDGDYRDLDVILDIIKGDATIHKLEKFAEPIHCILGEEYNFINSEGSKCKLQFVNSYQDYYCRKMGNMFSTDATIPKEQRLQIVKDMKS